MSVLPSTFTFMNRTLNNNLSEDLMNGSNFFIGIMYVSRIAIVLNIPKNINPDVQRNTERICFISREPQYPDADIQSLLVLSL
jgi:hypothetical protein